ncbi:hypothetical protein CC53_gp172 [Rhizobium phage vB_RleS_L338C]|uniref:hypothetical protein n=1 Tax=Rhizobium phage vB_RleS_L338C TaxID=1414737 RepID=UPI0003D8F15A|nr:hypothetical protein CC53_gp172 [Rhizobium phage vB_RleS_L338C]AHC30589.1 hypothetical protein L338C_172 [Rhizobium phage vB_RleS_L338C]QNH72111.1 hypothetical protein P11VFA_146 [Rhizobium phage P11VFA]
MLDPLTIDPKELGFSWVDETGKYRCWMTERMNRYAERYLKPIVIEVDHDYAKHIFRACGIEQHRLLRITPQVIAQRPVLYVELGDGSHKLVDGNHRYLKASLLGWKDVPAYLFKKKLADDFELDIPPHMNEKCKQHIPSFSGIR